MKNFSLGTFDWETGNDRVLQHENKNAEEFKKDVKESFKFATNLLLKGDEETFLGDYYIGDTEVFELAVKRLISHYGYSDIEYEGEIFLQMTNIIRDDYDKDFKKMVGKKLFDKVVAYNQKQDSELFKEDEES